MTAPSPPVTKMQPEAHAEAPLPRAPKQLPSPDPGPEQGRVTGAYARYGHKALDLVLLGIALPLAVLPAIGIGLVNAWVFRDPRKILFFQERVGQGGKIFRMVKFRTMRELGVGSMDSWSTGKDQLRVTPFGRLLRNSHLDELPQLLNVLRGEMSFIGPRPEMVEIEEWARERVPGFSRRLAVKPGISGYAQITQGYTGRDEEAYREKLAINEHYLDSISLRTDLEIVLRTIVWMIRGKGWDWKPTPAVSGSSEGSAGDQAERILVPRKPAA